MKAKRLIDALGGPQATANLINSFGGKNYSRQRVHNWSVNDHIPPYAQIDYKKLWIKAERLARKNEDRPKTGIACVLPEHEIG